MCTKPTKENEESLVGFFICKICCERRKCGSYFTQKNMDGFHTEYHGSTMVLYIEKEVDHHLAHIIRREVDDQIDQGKCQNLIMDFEGVPFMDSSGIGMVIGRQRKVNFFGGKVAISGIGPGIRRVFSMSGLFSLVPQYSQVDDALRVLSK